MEDCPEGYPRLAAFLSSDHNVMVYRGFNYLHSRCLLYQQDELVALERRLDEMDKDDEEDADERVRKCLRSRELDDVRKDQPRRSLLREIKDKLSEYGRAILLTLPVLGTLVTAAGCPLICRPYELW